MKRRKEGRREGRKEGRKGREGGKGGEPREEMGRGVENALGSAVAVDVERVAGWVFLVLEEEERYALVIWLRVDDAYVADFGRIDYGLVGRGCNREEHGDESHEEAHDGLVLIKTSQAVGCDVMRLICG